MVSRFPSWTVLDWLSLKVSTHSVYTRRRHPDGDDMVVTARENFRQPACVLCPFGFFFNDLMKKEIVNKWCSSDFG